MPSNDLQPSRLEKENLFLPENLFTPRRERKLLRRTKQINGSVLNNFEPESHLLEFFIEMKHLP